MYTYTIKIIFQCMYTSTILHFSTCTVLNILSTCHCQYI